jgi:phospholipid/cholesterol/gamma-HCH transport system substrate-binding protein
MTRVLRRVAGFVLSSRGALLGVLAAGSVAGVAFGIGGSSDHTVLARFRDVSGLVVGNEVRIAGIEAGSVKSIAIRHDAQHGPCATTTAAAGSCDPHAQPGDSDEYAEVTLSINNDRWPLREGTVVNIRPKGVLSNVDVTIDNGPASGKALNDGSVFDFNMASPQTTWPINLDQFTDIFGKYVKDPNVQVTDAIKTQIAQGNVAFANNGAQNLNATIANLNPLTRDLAPLTQVLADRTPELSRLNYEFNTISAELATEDSNLRGLINNGNVLFAAIVEKQQALQSLLDNGATTFATLNTALAGEEQNLITIFEKGPPALDKIKQSSDLVTPLLNNVNPHVPSLDLLLHYFATATGYVSNGVDTLRVDASLPPTDNSRSAVACGGEPSQQPNCTTKIKTASSAAAGSSASSSGATTQSDQQPLAGGMFG